MKKTTRFKQLIEAPEILVMPAIHDTLSAVLIEKAGFAAAAVGGYSTTATLLGKPDMSWLTQTEMADQVARVADAVSIPILADGDTGHGGFLNVQRTVKLMERAGAGAIFIEDQLFPKRCGHMEGKQVIPAEEMVGKIKAALDARIDPDFMITARTDALATHGLDEALRRAALYREAGADMIFVEAPTTVEQMRRITREIDAPTMANNVDGGKTPLLSAGELEEIGYATVAFAVSCTYAVTHALQRMLKILKETGTTEGFHDQMLDFETFNELMGLSELRKKEAGYSE